MLGMSQWNTWELIPGNKRRYPAQDKCSSPEAHVGLMVSFNGPAPGYLSYNLRINIPDELSIFWGEIML
jgi:hypothetical protein